MYQEFGIRVLSDLDVVAILDISGCLEDFPSSARLLDMRNNTTVNFK